MARKCGLSASGVAGDLAKTASGLADVLCGFNEGDRTRCLAVICGAMPAAVLPAEVSGYLSGVLREFDGPIRPGEEMLKVRRAALAERTAVAVHELDREILAYVVEWSLE